MSTTLKNPEKARRAAAHPDRPGRACRAPSGTFVPVVDRGRCEGKSDCVAACPYDVFEVGKIAEEEAAPGSLSLGFGWVAA